jgi:hypothetical protein
LGRATVKWGALHFMLVRGSIRNDTKTNLNQVVLVVDSKHATMFLKFFISILIKNIYISNCWCLLFFLFIFIGVEVLLLAFSGIYVLAICIHKKAGLRHFYSNNKIYFLHASPFYSYLIKSIEQIV